MNTNAQANLKQLTVQVTDQVAPRVTPQVARVLGAARLDCSFADFQAAAGLKDRVHFLKTHLKPLLLAGWIERTIPDKPLSSKQKDRLTENGRQSLRSPDKR
ncbi:MAG: Fic family protein [Candidatus Aminicenantales bacterium]